MYCLDTNAIIFYFKNKGNVARHIYSTPRNEIAVPSIVLFELTAGALKSNNSKTALNLLDDFISELTVLPFDSHCARAAATIRKALESTGNQIGPFDLLIAGTAKAYGSILVTNNIREFSRVPGLVLEDWL